MDSIYVYGIIDGKKEGELPVSGLGEGNAYFVPFKDVSALVSRTAFREYDPTEDNTLAHERVIQEIIRQDLTIAPMRFCTVLRTRNDLQKLLHSAYLPFKRNILKVRDRREFSVKVFLDVEKLQEEVGEGLVLEKSKSMAEELYERLKGKADADSLDEQVTREMIMNCSFLVHKGKAEEFYREISEFDKDYSDKLKIRISGPTAPYNFVKMPTK